MKIDKNVPLPVERATKVVALQKMEVGDSFLVSNDDANAWRNAMTKASDTGEFYYVSRTVEGGVRIWRKS